MATRIPCPFLILDLADLIWRQINQQRDVRRLCLRRGQFLFLLSNDLAFQLDAFTQTNHSFIRNLNKPLIQEAIKIIIFTCFRLTDLPRLQKVGTATRQTKCSTESFEIGSSEWVLDRTTLRVAANRLTILYREQRPVRTPSSLTRRPEVTPTLDSTLTDPDTTLTADLSQDTQSTTIEEIERQETTLQSEY